MQDSPGNVGPLAGVTVVDFTHILAGPYCTQLLADAGAYVIKIEPPWGEYARIRGPRRVGADGTELSSFNAAVNRGKNTIALDLKNPAGLELALNLISAADVVIENFAPGSLKRVGVDFAGLRKQDPSLITASISLFGASERAGNLADRGGLAIIAEAEGGIMDGVRGPDGLPGSPGLALGDMAAGLATYGAITTALFDRLRTGIGRSIDTAMVGVLISMLGMKLTGAQIDDDATYSAMPAGMGTFKTRDGYVTVGVNSDALYARLVAVLGIDELRAPEFSGYRERDLHAPQINALIADWAAKRSSNEIVDLIAAAKVPVGRVSTADDLLADPKFRQLGFFDETDDGLGGTITTPANPFGYHAERNVIPLIGADTDEILRGTLRLSAESIDDYRARGAFGSQPADVAV